MTLCDSNLAKLLEKFFTVHMRLMKDWGEFDAKNISFGGRPHLFCFLPENFLTDMIECFTEIIKIHPKGYKAILTESVIAIFEFCMILIRTDSKSITNPHTKTKALELMTLFLYLDQKNQLTADFTKSDIINKHLMETVVKFYVDIEFAGDRMFYTKF